jgi:hypothetical protein
VLLIVIRTMNTQEQVEEFLDYEKLKAWKEQFISVKQKLDSFYELMDDMYQTLLAPITDDKEFAVEAKRHKYSPLFFEMKRNNKSSRECLTNPSSIRNLGQTRCLEKWLFNSEGKSILNIRSYYYLQHRIHSTIDLKAERKNKH